MPAANTVIMAKWVPKHQALTPRPPQKSGDTKDTVDEDTDLVPLRFRRHYVRLPPGALSIHTNSTISNSSLKPPEFLSEVEAGLKSYVPKSTKSGVNGSFFVFNTQAQRCAIFKPMSMEAGMPKNHRLDQAHNIQFRKSILPGQGAGNEVLAYGLDQNAFNGRYGIPETLLISLNSPAFQGPELGSVQRFIPHTCALSDLSHTERDSIPKIEWQKLNFRLITGSTDAHYGNILYNKQTQKLYLIDSGDDFIGEEGQCQFYNPWVVEHLSKQPMSSSEYYDLSHLEVWKVMEQFEKTAVSNEKQHQNLGVSIDKYLTLALRLFVAKSAGNNRLTQAQWASLLTPHKDYYGTLHRSPVEKIYDAHIQTRWKNTTTWRWAANRVNWQHVQADIEKAVLELNPRRRMLDLSAV